MAKILTAKDYAERIVIKVCLNPSDPESIHPDGKPHTGQPPTGTDPGLKPWEWCHECRYNWDVREFTWTGEERYTLSSKGRKRLKSNAELPAEIKAAIATPEPPRERGTLTGQAI